MISKEKQIVRQVVDDYLQTGKTDSGEVKVTLLAENKTSCVEQVTVGDSRTIMLDEYRLNGRVIWAAYSSRTGTVYLSQAR